MMRREVAEFIAGGIVNDLTDEVLASNLEIHQ